MNGARVVVMHKVFKKKKLNNSKMTLFLAHLVCSIGIVSLQSNN